MNISDLVSRKAVLTDLRVSTKKELFQALSQKAADLAGEGHRAVFDCLLDRERLGTTGVGYGCAIPHARFPGITETTGLFARLASPIDYDAIDDQPVDLVFLLLVPDAPGSDHLKALAKISRIFRNGDMRHALRQAPDADAIHTILTNEESVAEAAQ